MTIQSKHLIAASISSVLALSCLMAISSPAFAKVTIGKTKPGSQTYTIDQWPETQKKLCGKCQSGGNSEENKVSVPEPSSVIALLILGSSLLLTNKVKQNYLALTKK